MLKRLDDCINSIALLLFVFLIVGCDSGQKSSDSEVAGRAKWLSACLHDEQCAVDQMCLSGICTRSCDANDGCRDLAESAQCTAAFADDEVASCQIVCDTADDCSGELSCVAGRCIQINENVLTCEADIDCQACDFSADCDAQWSNHCVEGRCYATRTSSICEQTIKAWTSLPGVWLEVMDGQCQINTNENAYFNAILHVEIDYPAVMLVVTHQGEQCPDENGLLVQTTVSDDNQRYCGDCALATTTPECSYDVATQLLRGDYPIAIRWNGRTGGMNWPTEMTHEFAAGEYGLVFTLQGEAGNSAATLFDFSVNATVPIVKE